MDKDEVKGKMKDVGGRIERQAGEWTGDKEMQGEGAAKQVEGKVQNAFGKVKDAARDAKDKMDRKMHSDNTREDDRDIKDRDVA
jgi:uncharacterized protein YjbJ (UPF0337 family)